MRKRVIIDANLLVLLIVGSAQRRYISKHKRCKIFTESDYDILLLMLSEAAAVLYTPNTLTEASNLAAQIEEPARGQIRQRLKFLIETGLELYISSKDAASEPIFDRLGLTDAALIKLSRDNAIILTVDFDLYAAAFKAGCEAINFNHYIAATR